MDKNIVFLSTYSPRQCGIATFTEDLVKNLKAEYPLNSYKIAAINDKYYEYGNEVLLTLNQFKKSDYIMSAKKLNESNTDLVVIEHEYGIYGGSAGDYLLDFINNLKIPFVTTLHTILSNPDEKQKEIVHELGVKSQKLIIMSKNSENILESVYNIPKGKIKLIHHGVPDLTVDSRKNLKKKFGYEKNSIISTFGLISPGKGIEYAIESMGKVAKKHPEAIYLILGKTHPCIQEKYGETYRDNLKDIVKSLSIENNVTFINKYLTKQEIVDYLAMSDIYMTPYLGEEQSVSGTLAYAVGYGKAIVSTPYRYAREMLKNRRGVLAEFKNSDSLYNSIEYLLDNPERRLYMEKNMLNLGKNMRWPKITEKYNDLFNEIIKNNEYKKQVV